MLLFHNDFNMLTFPDGHYLTALPPYKEQQVIIPKVERLLSCCDQLEKQIGKSQKDSELLMRTVLKEAFEG